MKFEIPIYEVEQDIKEQIIKSSVTSSLAKINKAEPFDLNGTWQSDPLQKLIASERKNIDLYYLHSILVSSVWNENDELFLPSEIWYSRNTAKDKPFNYEHECDDIIGHMTNGYMINEIGERLPEDTKPEDLPDLVHIFNQAVLYRHWDKKDKQERMDKIIEELPDEWFVSVECLLPDFDYALKDKEGKIEIVSRNKKTAFLTKYLRIFNGEGVYEGKRIARVPRNFIISGKGLVKRPANKNSIIIAKQVFDNSNLQNINKVVYNSNVDLNKKAINMDNVKELEYQTKIQKLESDFQKLQASVAENEVTKVKVELGETKKVIEAKDQEISALKASVEKLHIEKNDLAKIGDELIKSKEVLEKEISEIKDKAKIQTRLASVKSALNYSDEDAQVFVTKTDKLDDEAFGKLVEFNKKYTSETKVVSTTVEMKKEDVVKAAEQTKDNSLVVNTVDDKEKLKKIYENVAAYMSKNHVKPGKNKFVEAK